MSQIQNAKKNSWDCILLKDCLKKKKFYALFLKCDLQTMPISVKFSAGPQNLFQFYILIVRSLALKWVFWLKIIFNDQKFLIIVGNKFITILNIL